jgi:LPXTG-site transpeptidase (sortase) family protein
MKKITSFLLISFFIAIGLLLTNGEQKASSNVRAVTNTPSESSPTPLPTEFLTSTPIIVPPTLVPTPIPTFTSTVLPTQLSTPTLPKVTATPQSAPIQTTPVLPALGLGEAGTADLTEGSPILRVVIPDLALDTLVDRVPYDAGNWDISNLGAWVGWLDGSSRPGLGGNTVLVGHLNIKWGAAGPFEKLWQLQPGAYIIVYTIDKVYIYQVKTLMVVAADDVSVLRDGDQPILTLLTCYPLSWDAVQRVYLKRQVVVAELSSFDNK